MRWWYQLKQTLGFPSYIPLEVRTFQSPESFPLWHKGHAQKLSSLAQEHPEAWATFERLGIIPYLESLPPLPETMIREILWRWWQLAHMLPYSLPLWHHMKPVSTTASLLEVGVKDWAVLPAMAGALHWLQHQQNTNTPICLHGVELAPWQLTMTQEGLISRYEKAQYTQQILSRYPSLLRSSHPLSTRYIPESLQTWQIQSRQHYNLLAVFLPFVQLETHQAWGLSAQSYQPLSFWESLFRCASQEHPTLLWVSHQGQWEADSFDTWYEAHHDAFPKNFSLTWLHTQEVIPHWVPLRYPHILRVGKLQAGVLATHPDSLD